MKTALALTLLGCLAGCSGGAGGAGASPGSTGATPASEPQVAATPAASPAQARPVIGQLRTRDRKVTLLASKDGLRVTLEDAFGAILAEDVAVDDLKTKDPLVYELCRSSVASNHYYLDARLDLPVRREMR